MFKGILTTMIATPTNAGHPSKLNKDTKAIRIWKGAEIKRVPLAQKPWSRVASTAMKLTMPPVDFEVRAEDERSMVLE